MAEKKRTMGCFIGCVCALAVIVFVPSLRRMIISPDRQSQHDAEYAGIVQAIDELPYAHAYLPKIDHDQKSLHFSATVDNKTDYIEEAGNVIRNINAYLSANPDTPEHQYDCQIKFSIEGYSTPSFLNCYNFDIQDKTGKTERKPYFFKCMYDGGHCNPIESELKQLSELECLESLELQNCGTAPEYYEPLDTMENLQTLRIMTYSAVPKEIRDHLKETHPECRIIVNNMKL